jgi:hypothetical protein
LTFIGNLSKLNRIITKSMNIMKIIRLYTLILFSSLLLVACGGGGGSSSTATATPTTLSGTAATGAPLENAAVSIFDSNGNLVGSTTTDENGRYSLEIGSQFTPPFTIQVQGTSGDGSTTLYSLAPSTGTANVNQITNAIAANLSTDGNPSSLAAGTSKTASDISAADSAYSAALTNIKNTVGITTSFITGTFNAAYDKLLDNVTVDVRKSTGITMITSTGMAPQSNDLLAESTVNTPYLAASFSTSSLPSAALANRLPAPVSNSTLLSVPDLEFLRNKLQSCFAIPSVSRGTPANPASACAGLDSPQGDYLHAGFYWLDTSSGTGCTNANSFCRGLLGSMLSNADYDQLKFKVPQIIRPLDDSGTTWVVKFPIEFSDGSLASFGEAISSSYMVLKKYAANGSDPGWRFYGDQRKINSYIEVNNQRIENVYTGGVRYETGLNIYVNANRLRAVTPQGAVHVRKVVVTDLGTASPVLPPNGITLYNKGQSGSDSRWNNQCGGFMSISQSSSPTFCNGVLRLSYTQTGSYGVTSPTDAFLSGWANSQGQSTIDGNSGYLSQDQISSIVPGRPFKFEITLNDGIRDVEVINYVNRVHTSPYSASDNQALNYPLFSSVTVDAMKSYLGGNGAFNMAWDFVDSANVNRLNPQPRPFSAAIYWDLSSFSTTVGLNQDKISQKSVSIVCTGSGANACGNEANWGRGAGRGGLAQIRARTGDGVHIWSQIRQY